MIWAKHQILEKSSILLLVGILLTVVIGGIVEIAPLFWLSSTIEKVEGMRPYTPLELAGRDIYVREGCYLCHSQMIRSLRDEVERYGHYSLAAESMYDHPFQWGSKRTGPDLARVGGKYSDEWHVAHLTDPRAVVPESIMPGYPWLARRELDYKDARRVSRIPMTTSKTPRPMSSGRSILTPRGSRTFLRAIRRRKRGRSTATRAMSPSSMR
jgi:cytochrome c oxidase cbb3-type subunit II